MARETITQRTRQSLVRKAVDFLERSIVSGHYSAGYRLVESEIADALNISRTPVREAFQILAASGLLTNSTRRGAIVAGLSRKEVENLFDVRSSLEDLAISLAAPKIKRASHDKLWRVNEKMKECIETKDIDKFRLLDRKFHTELLKFSDNKELEDILVSLDKKISRIRYLTLKLPGEMEASYRFHAALLQAISNNDVERARVLRREESHENKVKLLSSFPSNGFRGVL